MMKTPEQHQSRRSCAFIVGLEQIFYVGFHSYLTHFRNSFFDCFEQVNAIWEGYQKFKKIDDLIHFSNVQLGKVLA